MSWLATWAYLICSGLPNLIPEKKNFLPWNRFTYSETSEKPFLRSFERCISAVFTTFKSQTRLEESDNKEIETTRIVFNSFWNLFVWTHLWFLIHGCSKIQIYNSFQQYEGWKLERLTISGARHIFQTKVSLCSITFINCHPFSCLFIVHCREMLDLLVIKDDWGIQE